MRMQPTGRRVRALLGIAIAVLALGATVYAFRARLAGAPVIGRLFSQPDRAIGSGGPRADPGSGAPGDPRSPGAAPSVDPRAEINIDPKRQQLIGVRLASVEQTQIMPTVRAVGAITDADVSVEFYMAAMPSMNMPEMRSSVPLKHEAAGRYRGTGTVAMAGAWDVTVSVKRAGSEIASKKLTVTAK